MRRRRKHAARSLFAGALRHECTRWIGSVGVGKMSLSWGLLGSCALGRRGCRRTGNTYRYNRTLLSGQQRVGISSRGLGTVSFNASGAMVVNSDFQLISVDWIIGPSPGASTVELQGGVSG